MPGGDSPEFQTLYEQGQAARLAGDLDSAAELLTAAVTLQPTTATLTDSEIDTVSGKIIAAVAKHAGGVLRG